MKTANLAIVFTDIKGFTERTGRQTYEENRRMLRLHDALLMPVVRAFGGRLVKTIGDALLVVFVSPTKAVLCGAAIQDRLWDYNRRAAPPEQIHVRVAVNQGEVREEKGDVFGEPVNIAARVEGLADAGEVLFTEAVYLSMNRAEVPSEEFGEHELKGIADRVRIYRVPTAAYRLTGQPGTEAEQQANPSPPYGGLGLSRIPALPEPDPVALAKETDLVPQLLAAGSELASRMEGLRKSLPARHRSAVAQLRLEERFAVLRPGPRASALIERSRAALAPLGDRVRALSSRGRAVLGLALLAAALGAGFLLVRGDAIERAISRGDLRGAHAQANKLAEPAHSFAEGRICEAEMRWNTAASDYQAAARAGESSGYSRLVRLLRSDYCAARSAAAQALGDLGDDRAASALERLRDAKSLPDEGEDSLLGSIFGCSSRRAARDALESLNR